MSNGLRSHAPDQDLIKDYPNIYYEDHVIPKGTQIAGGQIMIDKVAGSLMGVKFWDADRGVILNCGHIDATWIKEKTISEFKL